MKKDQEYAILTDIITQDRSGMTTHRYKQYIGLKTKRLRDNMTDLELILNILAEATEPQTLAAHKAVVRQDGTIARNARL